MNGTHGEEDRREREELSPMMLEKGSIKERREKKKKKNVFLFFGDRLAGWNAWYFFLSEEKNKGGRVLSKLLVFFVL